MMGASAYTLIEHYKDLILGQFIIEIGSSRGEGSTDYLLKFSKQNHKKLITVDVRPDVIDYYNNLQDNTIQALNDSENFIGKIEHDVCFAYLDGFDYIPPDDSINHQWMKDMIEDYKQRNPDSPHLWLTNENSSRHHLEKTKKLLPLMSNRSIFLFDDTFVPADLKHVTWFKDAFDPSSKEYTSWHGKGATAVPYLISLGWSVLPRIKREGRDDYVAVKNFTD